VCHAYEFAEPRLGVLKAPATALRPERHRLRQRFGAQRNLAPGARAT
jgi:hypothetical protein